MAKTSFTTNEAAAVLGVTPARVRQMVLTGLLSAEKFGRDLAIPPESIEAAKQRKTTPGPIPGAKLAAAQPAKRRTRRAA